MIAPSDVVLVDVNPLGGTFGRSEREVAAALVVRACQLRGGWAAVSMSEIEDLIANKDPWTVDLLRNPFHTPNFVELVERGFARWIEAPADESPERQELLTETGGTIELTDVALDRLQRSIWIRRAS